MNGSGLEHPPARPRPLPRRRPQAWLLRLGGAFMLAAVIVLAVWQVVNLATPATPPGSGMLPPAALSSPRPAVTVTESRTVRVPQAGHSATPGTGTAVVDRDSGTAPGGGTRPGGSQPRSAGTHPSQPTTVPAQHPSPSPAPTPQPTPSPSPTPQPTPPGLPSPGPQPVACVNVLGLATACLPLTLTTGGTP